MAATAGNVPVPDTPAVLERRATDSGELVLRRAGGHLELILNGVFLMSTRNGASERALVREAVAGQERARILLAGLGMGCSLAEALASTEVGDVVVVEAEPDIIRWGSTYFRDCHGGGLADPRVSVVCADLGEYAARCRPDSFDAICLDIDNGPDWLVRPANAAIYSPAGLERLRALLRPGGRLTVWAAQQSAGFAAVLSTVFGGVRVKAFQAGRGPDDVVYVAARPSGVPAVSPPAGAAGSR